MSTRAPPNRGFEGALQARRSGARFWQHFPIACWTRGFPREGAGQARTTSRGPHEPLGSRRRTVHRSRGPERRNELACLAGRTLSGLMLVLGLVKCGGGDGIVPAECLPGEEPRMESGMATVDALDVYLDVSQSSTNFGRASGESAYRDLIAWLLGLRPEFAETRIHGFADKIAEVDEDIFVRAASGEVNPLRCVRLFGITPR